MGGWRVQTRRGPLVKGERSEQRGGIAVGCKVCWVEGWLIRIDDFAITEDEARYHTVDRAEDGGR